MSDEHGEDGPTLPYAGSGKPQAPGAAKQFFVCSAPDELELLPDELETPLDELELLALDEVEPPPPAKPAPPEPPGPAARGDVHAQSASAATAIVPNPKPSAFVDCIV